MEPLTIGALADAVGVNVETIRYYERRDLLPPPARTAAGYRQYTSADLWRLRFILRAKALGFTLREIGALLGDDGSPRAVDDVRAVTTSRLEAVEAEIARLARRRADLETLLRTCESGRDEECLGLSVTASE